MVARVINRFLRVDILNNCTQQSTHRPTLLFLPVVVPYTLDSADRETVRGGRGGTEKVLFALVHVRHFLSLIFEYNLDCDCTFCIQRENAVYKKKFVSCLLSSALKQIFHILSFARAVCVMYGAISTHNRKEREGGMRNAWNENEH